MVRPTTAQEGGTDVEETAPGGLGLAILICRLFFGAVDCGDHPAPGMPVTDLPPTPECAGTIPWYELVLEADGEALDDQDAATIEDRLTQPGVCRLVVHPEGAGSIRLGIATADNPLDLVQPALNPGVLSFHRVVDDLPPGAPVGPDQMALASMDDDGRAMIVEIEPLLEGQAIESADAAIAQHGGWAITVRFTDKGRERFGDITTDLLGRRLAIVLDRQVMSAPYIQEPIIGGSAMISGSFDEAQARLLAAILNSDPLPPGVHVVSIEMP